MIIQYKHSCPFGANSTVILRWYGLTVEIQLWCKTIHYSVSQVFKNMGPATTKPTICQKKSKNEFLLPTCRVAL